MRFAYLIMAHDNQLQLELLLKSLDYKGNEIFLHIDKKNIEIDTEFLKNMMKKAIIHIYKRYKVYWGDISQTKCQLFLLKMATKNHHDYYHLLSGKDLLIKNNKFISRFFEVNSGKEFVHFDKKKFSEKEECIYYHLFFYFIQRTKNRKLKSFLIVLHNKSITIQRHFGVQRKFYNGANWFSITHKLATDLIKNRRKILRKLHFIISSDECILQTFINKVSRNEYDLFCYREDDYTSIMRLIDWHRGAPYVFRNEDYEELISSDRLFARKFDEKIDFDIINKISNYIESEMDEK